jgi:hypothetical protein
VSTEPPASRSPAIVMDNLMGAGAKELVAAMEIPGAAGLAAQLNKASRWRLLRQPILARYEMKDPAVGWLDPAPGARPHKLGAPQAQWFQDLVDAWRELTQTCTLWRVTASRHVQRRYEHPHESCQMMETTAGLKAPRILSTDMQIPGLVAGEHALYFLPDRLLVWEKGRFAEMPYAALRAEWQSMPFIETRPLPKDAAPIRTTWEYVNKKGERHGTLKNNREWPLMSYGRIEFSSEAGLRWILLSSQTQATHHMINTLRSVPEPGAIASVRAISDSKHA